MLYLNPPYWLIQGLSLFPDHADPAQYYYLPAMPRLTTRPEAGVDVPQLQLIKYRGLAGGGGFLNVDVDLGVPQGVLDDAASELRSQLHHLGQDVVPRLAPVPIVDGAVRMLLLGQQSALPTDPVPKPGTTPADPTRFVLKIQSAAKPSLYGDENATFSVQLDQDGVAIVEKALQGELSPIGVVYSLDFFALRPAWAVRARVDWDRVQTHLDESFGVDALFFSSEVDKVIDELRERQAIVVEADTYVPDDADTKDLAAHRDQAYAQVREMIKSTFFQSSIQPPKPGEPDGWDKATKAVNDISRIAVSGGLSSFAGLSYKKVDLTRIDRKTLNVNFQERTTVRKSIWPQGHLGGLFRLARGGLPLDRFLTSVDLDQDYFKHRKVEAIARADFERDGIQSVHVTLRYKGEPRTLLLEPGAGKDRQSAEWLSALEGGAMVRPVDYGYTVTFKDADRSERPVTLDTGGASLALSTIEDQLEIVPRDLLYAMADVPVSAIGFPWDRYTQVDVECRYLDEANAIRLQRVVSLTKAAPSGVFRMFMRDPARRQFEYRARLYAALGADEWLPADWTPCDDEQVVVRDPHPRVRKLVVVPQVDWNAVDRVFVDLSFQHGPGADDLAEDSFEFNAKDAASRTFAAHPVDPQRKLVTYRVTLLMKNGATVRVPTSVTAEPRLLVRADMVGHRVISLAPRAGAFAGHVTQIAVDLRYLDAPRGLSFADRLVLRTADDRGTFEYDYADEKQPNYEVKVTTTYEGGLGRETDWLPAADDDLRVPLA